MRRSSPLPFVPFPDFKLTHNPFTKFGFSKVYASSGSLDLLNSTAAMPRANRRLCRQDSMLGLSHQRSNYSDTEIPDCGNPRRRQIISEELNYPQCLLVSHDGVLHVQRPPIRMAPAMVKSEWLPTELDLLDLDICDHGTQSRQHDIVGPWIRQQGGPARRKYLSQKRLCFENGLLVYRTLIRPPRNLGPIQNFCFLALPYEIREQIYQELLVTDLWIHDLKNTRSGGRPWCLYSQPGARSSDNSDFVDRWPEILATCSRIYNEARIFLFKQSTFLINYTDSPIIDNWHRLHGLPYRVLSDYEISSITNLRVTPTGLLARMANP